MKAVTLLKDFFAFNRKELHGILVLTTLIFLVFLAGRVVPVFTANRPFDTTGLTRDARLLEAMMRMQDSLDSVSARKKHRAWKTGSYGATRESMDSASTSFPEKKTVMVELNSADSFDLQQLRGIGPGYARRILRYRDRLGGFVSKNQVLEVWGMDTARFNGISASIWVKVDSIRKIDLNTVTFKELLYHPYFPFDVTKAIMLYRKDKKKLRSVEEVMGVAGMTDSLYRKILPYIRVK